MPVAHPRVKLWPRSVRGRLAALTAAGSLLVGAATGALLLASMRDEVGRAVDDGLETRADDIESSLRAGTPTIVEDEAYAQILTVDGDVVVSSATLAGGGPVLTPEELGRAEVIQTVFDRAAPRLGDHARLLARPVRLGDLEVVVVVGTNTAAEVTAQQHLRSILLVAVPALSLLLGVTAWWVAGRALRPAERMADEAETISLTEPGRRLPVPSGDHELAHLGERLNAMLARMEAAYEHERAFLDDASHELRTPLAVLRGELELALDATTPGAIDEALRSALEETDRLAAITTDLLTLARADGGELALRPEPVDARAVCEAVRDRVVDGRIAVDITGDARVQADRHRLEQIVTNLVVNAARHASSRVHVAIERRDTAVEIEVADDGHGFPPELLPRAFERFSRASTDRQRGEGRTGLGLAIVATLTQAHGGSVAARNGPPLGGAVVTVRLPPA